MADSELVETLDNQARQLLRQLARKSVAAAAAGENLPDPLLFAREQGLEPGPSLLAPRGAFVTLTKNGQLRGCIGYIEGIKPLLETVVENSASAAVNDPRFRPVEPTEVAALDLEISVLSPLSPVKGPDDIVVGTHGILLEKSGHRAVFLPQVAPEQGWDLPTTLTHLALKAGLDPHAWRKDCRFMVFTAHVF